VKGSLCLFSSSKKMCWFQRPLTIFSIWASNLLPKSEMSKSTNAFIDCLISARGEIIYRNKSISQNLCSYTGKSVLFLAWTTSSSAKPLKHPRGVKTSLLTFHSFKDKFVRICSIFPIICFIQFRSSGKAATCLKRRGPGPLWKKVLEIDGSFFLAGWACLDEENLRICFKTAQAEFCAKEKKRERERTSDTVKRGRGGGATRKTFWRLERLLTILVRK